MVELENVTKLYGKVIGVNDITLSLSCGAYGLLGPNGSGKTTLLNLLTGQLRPTIGSVRTLGESPRNNPEFHRRIGYCPGVEGMYTNVSGHDWLVYLLKLQGFRRREALSLAKDALELVGMTSAMHRPIANCSRGMRQRIKLAQALSHNPEMLILDEPLNGLDPVGRHEISLVLRDWINLGKSLLLSSHILHEVEAITPSFLLICGGRLLASGSASDVHEILADIPNRIRIHCSNPRKLAELMIHVNAIDQVGIDDETVTVVTRNPASLYAYLPDWIEGTDLRIDEIHSGDESLQDLFSSLMKIHRGQQ